MSTYTRCSPRTCWCKVATARRAFATDDCNLLSPPPMVLLSRLSQLVEHLKELYRLLRDLTTKGTTCTPLRIVHCRYSPIVRFRFPFSYLQPRRHPGILTTATSIYDFAVWQHLYSAHYYLDRLRHRTVRGLLDCLAKRVSK